ncbi:MAG TPA: hypothetical protein VHB77_05260 [Planctomycetaceae bacterium]|nr:hypothetical protein [Planctomycetaceae bacterium]
MHPRSCTRRRRPSLLAIVGRALLALSLWQGPIPWAHVHAVAAADAEANDVLARHLLHFHPDHSPSLAFAWHVHFVLPWQINDNGDCERHPGAPDDCLASLKYRTPCSSPDVRVDAQALAHAPCPLAIIAPDTPLCTSAMLQIEGESPRDFLASFAGSVSLCDLIARRVC